MKTRALIVDDEPLARQRLRSFLCNETTVELIGECGDGKDALAAIHRAAPDLLFLDIQLPGCSGLQVLEEFPESRRPATIFTTAHERFALDAFDHAAVDFLLKPFDRARCLQALRRAQKVVHLRRATGAGAAPGITLDRITVRVDGRFVSLAPAEVVRVEGADNYVILYLTVGRLVVRETMATIEARLGSTDFIRISRSAIVNIGQIREIQPTGHDFQVLLRNGTVLPLSRKLRGKWGRFTNGLEQDSRRIHHSLG